MKWMPWLNLSHLIFRIELEFAIDCVFVMNLKTCLYKIAQIFHDHGELKCESCSQLIQAHPNQTKPKRTELGVCEIHLNMHSTISTLCISISHLVTKSRTIFRCIWMQYVRVCVQRLFCTLHSMDCYFSFVVCLFTVYCVFVGRQIFLFPFFIFVCLLRIKWSLAKSFLLCHRRRSTCAFSTSPQTL